MTMKSYFRRQFEKEIILSRHHPPGPFPFVVILDHLKATFNLGKIIRTANSLGAREVHLVGTPKFNPKPCKGTLKQTRTRSFDHFKASFEALTAEGYEVFALDPEGESVLGQCELPARAAFVVGHEEYGLSFNPADFPGIRRLRIPRFGQVQSLNASIAAGITCFEYLRQQGFSSSDTPTAGKSRPECAGTTRDYSGSARESSPSSAPMPLP